MPTTTASDLPTPEQMVDALFLGLRSGEYWLSAGFDGTLYDMILYPVGGADEEQPMERTPLAKFTGTQVEVMAQLIAYQVQVRLS